ncbi:LuxR C-terminal-related transcriptional regulator [Chitinophaga agri]|uniref:IS1595 family transposase n=1 Tax=Chitinophaga agri TaxID=2703787 RepID=A0A6B9ZI21_9BACT|nr:LuxR C-terminal-related transcriptional regulator [Chitinophaga agri]QHS61409.1 IS1595 family transposase [Chitinophaga agri]
MKNKYLKGAHLSERKFKEILRLFAEDLTATQIANISGVSRVTVNSYLKKIRQQIARHCESLSPSDNHNRTVAPARNVTHAPSLEEGDVSVKTEVGRAVKPVVFGIYRSSDRLHTEILPDVSRSMIHSVVRSSRSILEMQGAAEKIRRFSNVVDLGQYRLYNLENEGAVTIADDVDAFWGLTKHRLAKFKGLNRSTVYLHLKECEFRYNNRNEDIYETLLELLKAQPLSLS